MFWSFVITCLIIELTPGPNMAYLAILSASQGRRAGFAAIVGVAAGLCLVGIAAALGIAAAISNSIFVYQILRWLGVVYLLALAWEGWREGQEAPVSIAESNISLSKFFKNGLITNLLNPKAVVFYITVLPTFIDTSTNILIQTISLTLLYVAIATMIHCLIVMMAVVTANIFKEKHQILTIRRILSALLAVVAVWFAISTAYPK